MFPHPRPLSQRERGESTYEKISASVLRILGGEKGELTPPLE